MEKEREMANRKFGMHTQAVAGVIEALLMVGLVAVIISIIQLNYIPQVMNQKEADHMDQVFNQMSSLKSMIDLQAMTQSSTPISSMITLSSSGLGRAKPIRSGGMTLRAVALPAYPVAT